MTAIEPGSHGIKPGRVHTIDWLRIGAVLELIPFHTARIFDIWEPFYAKNAQVSVALFYFTT
jgi:glucan biosynthesis protein C